MLKKKIWIPILMVLLAVIGFGLFYARQVSKQEPVKVYKTVEVEKPETPKPPPPGETAESGHWHGDEWHAEPHAETQEAERLAGVEFIEMPENPPDLLPEAEKEALYAQLPSSAVPENIPEHLKLPEAFKNRYSPDKSDPNAPSITEVRAFMQQVIEYAIANHNPKRPIAEVWPAFMEAEMVYNTLAAQHLGKFPGYTGGSRIEWAYEQFWAFPEVSEVKNSGEYFNSLSTLVYDVELGLEDPNWNVTTLPDGRTFRMRRNHRYEFNYPGGGYRIGLSRPEHSKLVVIDNVFEISDAELEALSGWNYNFNPYTGKPITLYREPSYVVTQSGFLTE